MEFSHSNMTEQSRTDSSKKTVFKDFSDLHNALDEQTKEVFENEEFKNEDVKKEFDNYDFETIHNNS